MANELNVALQSSLSNVTAFNIKKQKSLINDKDLLARVNAIFMLDDNFFRSSFMRHKVPSLLFSNGSRGIESLFNHESTNLISPIRHSPTRLYDSLNSSNDESNHNNLSRFSDVTLNSDNKSNNNNISTGSEDNSNEINTITTVRNIPIQILGSHTNNEPQFFNKSQGVENRCTDNLTTQSTAQNKIFDYTETDHKDNKTMSLKNVSFSDNKHKINDNIKPSFLSTKSKSINNKRAASPRVTFSDEIEKKSIDSLDEKRELKLTNNINNKNNKTYSPLTLSRFDEKKKNERESPAIVNFRSTLTQSLPQRNFANVSYRVVPIIQKGSMQYSQNKIDINDNNNNNQHEKNKINNMSLFPSTSTGNLLTSNQNNFDEKLFITNYNQFSSNDGKNKSLKQFPINENKTQKSYLNNNSNIIFRSMNNTPVMGAKFSTPPASSSFSKIYSAIPFKSVGVKHELNGPISNAVSTPSLFENNLTQYQKQQQQQSKKNLASLNKINNFKNEFSDDKTLNNNIIQETSKIDNNLAEKKSLDVPSFLRRTQTAHLIPSLDLPINKCSKLTNKKDSSSQNRHSLHETQNLKTNFNEKMLEDTALTSSSTSNINSNNYNMSNTTSLSQITKQPLIKNSRFNGGTTSAKVKWKKGSFSSIPLCIRRNDRSDEEDQLINLKEQEQLSDSINNSLKNQSHLLNSTKINYNEQIKPLSDVDSVEKAIQSIESFNPNDYIIQGNNQPSIENLENCSADTNAINNKLYFKNNSKNRLSNISDIIPPYLPSLKLQSFADKSLTLSPTTSSGIVSDINDLSDNQRESTISSSSFSSNSVDVTSSGTNATNLTFFSSSNIKNLPSLNILKNNNLNKPERSVNFDQTFKNNSLYSNKLISLPSSSTSSSEPNSLSLLNNEILTQQRRPSAITYLHSSGSATPIFGQSSDTASTLTHTPRATTPVTFTNIGKTEVMGGNLSTNPAEDKHYRINNNNNKNEIIINDQSCNLSHNHPIYRNANNIKCSKNFYSDTDEFESDNFSHYDNVEQTNQPKFQKNNFYNQKDQNFLNQDDKFKNIQTSNYNKSSDFINYNLFMSNNEMQNEFQNNSINDSDYSIISAADAEAHLRKRFLCTQLTDCAKVIEINSHKMNQFTIVGDDKSNNNVWRQPHFLKQSLSAIRDTVYTIEFALDELVEALTRVNLDSHISKSQEFKHLCNPIFTSQNMIQRLRTNLDSTDWQLSILARKPGQITGNDALDQFVVILKQLPKDCYKVVQWIYLLDVWNADSRSSVFLSASNLNSLTKPPSPAPVQILTPIQSFKENNIMPRSSSHAEHNNSNNNSSAWFNNINLNRQQKQDQQMLNKQQHSTIHLSNNNKNIKPIEQKKYNKNSMRIKSPNTVKFQLTENCEFSEDLNHFDKLAQEQLRQYPKNSILQNSSSNNKSNLDINSNNINNILDLSPNNSSLSTIRSATVPEVMDGGESTTSSNTSSILDDSVIATSIPASTAKEAFTTITKTNQLKNNLKNENIYSNDTINQMKNLIEHIKKNENSHNHINTNTDSPPGTVYEEDDLISVVSESVDSFYGDYADILPKTNNNKHKFNSETSNNFNQRIQQKMQHWELVRELSAEEREMLKLHEPQVDSCAIELCRLVEDFFNIIEQRQSAKNFVQKIQMICIKGKTLVCIAQLVARDDACVSPLLHAFLDREATRLEATLNECVANARVAKEKSESVPAVQAMVSSVVAVSQAALEIKQFWKCCS